MTIRELIANCTIQWSYAAPCQPRFRVYGWAHPVSPNECRYVGIVMFGRELRFWIIKPVSGGGE